MTTDPPSQKRFKVVLVESDTGIVLNQAGQRHLRGQPSYLPRFETRAEALQTKDDLLALFPWACVTLVDEDAPNPAESFFPPDAARKEYEEISRAHARYCFAGPFSRFLDRTPLYPRDPNTYWIIRMEREFGTELPPYVPK